MEHCGNMIAMLKSWLIESNNVYALTLIFQCWGAQYITPCWGTKCSNGAKNSAHTLLFSSWCGMVSTHTSSNCHSKEWCTFWVRHTETLCFCSTFSICLWGTRKKQKLTKRLQTTKHFQTAKNKHYIHFHSLSIHAWKTRLLSPRSATLSSSEPLLGLQVQMPPAQEDAFCYVMFIATIFVFCLVPFRARTCVTQLSIPDPFTKEGLFAHVCREPGMEFILPSSVGAGSLCSSERWH